MIKVQMYLDGPREIEVPTPPGWETWNVQAREIYIRAIEMNLIDSSVAFIVSDGQDEDL